MAVSWQRVHPHKRWIMVKADPRMKKTAGGIHLTDELTGIERVMEGTGRVLRVGKEVGDYGVVEDDRVVFRGFLKDVSQGMIEPEDDCQIFLIRVEDIMAVIGEGVTMGAYSGSVQA